MATDHSQRVVKPSAVEFPKFTSKLVTVNFRGDYQPLAVPVEEEEEVVPVTP